MSEPMTERNPADVLADRLDELRREMELRFSGLFVENAVNRLSAAANFLRQPTQTDAMRLQGQAEGFAAAVQQLRDMSAQKPNPTLAVPAAYLADILEQSRISRKALEVTNG